MLLLEAGSKRGVAGISVLGPELFNIFCNDLEEGIDVSLINFAGDTKLWGSLTMLKDRTAIQRYPDRLEEGDKKNLVKYDRDKY